MIEAKVHLPNAGLAARAIVYGAASALVFAGLIATNAFPIASTLLAGGLWIWLVSPFLLRRRKWDHAEIEPEAGKIRMRGRRSLPRTIRTQSLIGASVARAGDGAVITLCERRSRAPTAIEVTTLEAADRIRSSLGVPHGGFGEISWSVQPGFDTVIGFARIFAAMTWIIADAFAIVGATAVSAALWTPAAFASAVAVLGAFALWFTPHRVLRMNAQGIDLTGAEPGRLAYSEISEIEDDGKALLFRENNALRLVIPCAPTTWISSGMRAEERALMIAQLRGALAASKGEVAPFVDPTSHLDQLRRRDAPASEWLARIDALAALQTDAAYRGAALAKEDLWRALESHDAAPDLRAGAARVLLRISPEKEQDRIAQAIASIHNDDERAHIRAALQDDVEEAAAELEATNVRDDSTGRS